MGVHFLGPDSLMHFAHPLAHFGYPLGALLVPCRYSFGSNWLSFPSLWYHVHCFSLLLAPTFKPNDGPTSFWLFVSVCSARFQVCGVCQCRYVLKRSNSVFFILYMFLNVPYELFNLLLNALRTHTSPDRLFTWIRCGR